MTARYDAVISRKDKDGKTRYTKIGAGFPAKNGEGFNIVLDALPMPNAEGQAWISLYVPKEKTDEQPKRAASTARGNDMDDSIPF